VSSVIRKRSFLSVCRLLGRRQHHLRRRRNNPSIIGAKTFQQKLYGDWEGGREPRRSEAAGFWLGNLHVKVTIEAGSTLA
jgi:hypothetical protein